MRKNLSETTTRVDTTFKKELQDIKVERIRRGIDRDKRSDRRLTKALVRSSIWGELKEVLINSELKDDRGFNEK